MPKTLQFFAAKKLICSTAAAGNPRAILGSFRLFIDDEKTTFAFLVDTGADVSVIPYNFFGKVIKQAEHQLVAANSSPIATYGTKLVQLSIGLRRVFSHCFTLAEVNRPIIGADFLAKHDLWVDLKRKRLIDHLTGQETIATIALVDTPAPKNWMIESSIFGEILKKYPTLVDPPDYKKPVVANDLIMK